MHADRFSALVAEHSWCTFESASHAQPSAGSCGAAGWGGIFFGEQAGSVDFSSGNVWSVCFCSKHADAWRRCSNPGCLQSLSLLSWQQAGGGSHWELQALKLLGLDPSICLNCSAAVTLRSGVAVWGGGRDRWKGLRHSLASYDAQPGKPLPGLIPQAARARQQASHGAMSAQFMADHDLLLNLSILPTKAQLLLQDSWPGANTFGGPLNRRRQADWYYVRDADADSHAVLLQGCKAGQSRVEVQQHVCAYRQPVPALTGQPAHAGQQAGGNALTEALQREALLAKLTEQLRGRLTAVKEENAQLEELLHQADARASGRAHCWT